MEGNIDVVQYTLRKPVALNLHTMDAAPPTRPCPTAAP